MAKPEPLWRALSVPSLMIGIGAVLGGDASAQLHGNAEILPATICLLFVIFIQLAANCYYRYQALLKETPSAYNGGSVPAMEPKERNDKILFYRVFSGGVSLIALMAGMTLIAMGGIWFAFLGVFVAVVCYLLVCGANPLLMSPWGSLFTFIMFGPVTVISTSMIQSLHEATDPLSWFDISPAIYMSITIGFLAANAYLAFVYSTYFKAKDRLRYTFPAVFGRRATRVLFIVNGVLASASITYSCFILKLDKPWIGVIPGLISLLITIATWWKMRTSPRYDLAKVATWACLNVFLLGLLASVATLFVGIPDDSHMHIF